MKLLSAVFILVMFSNAFGSYYVECGEGFNPTTGEFQKSVLHAGSENDNFTGPAGQNWVLYLGEKEVKTNATQKVSAHYSHKEAKLTFLLSRGTSPSGPVGTEYVVLNSNSDEPFLEVYTVGGFVGRLKRAEFPCVSAAD